MFSNHFNFKLKENTKKWLICSQRMIDFRILQFYWLSDFIGLKKYVKFFIYKLQEYHKRKFR